MNMERKVDVEETSDVVPLKVECKFCGCTERGKFITIRAEATKERPAMIGYHCQICHYLTVPSEQRDVEV